MRSRGCMYASPRYPAKNRWAEKPFLEGAAMFARKVSIGTAVFAALALAGLVRADVVSDISMVPENNVVHLDDAAMPASAPVASTPPSATVTPLNALLNKIPGYSDSGFSPTGYVEGSWTYSAPPPAGNIL